MLPFEVQRRIYARTVVDLSEPRWVFLNTMFSLSADAERLFERYGVDFVVLGPYEREQLEADPERFRSRFPRIIQTETYEVFRTSPPATD